MMFAVWMLALASPTDVVTVADAVERLNAGGPAGNPGQWVTSDDYPAEAMRQGHEGTSGFRLAYDATGRTTGCEITSPSGHAELDEATCRLLIERARFIPGRDAEGAQIGGTYSNRIRWRIPEGSELPPGPTPFMPENVMGNWPRGAFPRPEMAMLDPADHYPAAARAAGEEGIVHMRLAIDAEGKVADCTVTASSLSKTLDHAACDLMRREGRFVAALDEQGQPTTAVFSAHFDWTLPEEAGPEDAELAKVLDEAPPRAIPFPMSEPGSATMSILIEADGSVGDCTFSGTGPMIEQDDVSLCDVFGKQRYEPFVDADGKPVARRFIFRTDLTVEDAPAGKARP